MLTRHNVVKLLKKSYNFEMVLIFGKANCPYTQRAREDYTTRQVEFEYVDVKKNRADMERMLELSGGIRRVPVILEANGKVTIGFGGS